MKKLTFLAAFCLFFLQKSLAQLPEACPPGGFFPQGECETACVHCNFINGYQGTTDGQAPSSVPNYCGSIENDQWFGFVAATFGATFTAKPVAGSCDNGDGIQIAVYSACGGPFLQCNVGCSGCGDTPQSVAVTGMIPGQAYFVVIDGYAGDQCDFSISISPPSAVQAPQVASPGPISGPSSVCPGSVVTFCAPQSANAGAYVWSCDNPQVLLNGEPNSVEILGWTGNCVNVEFPFSMPNGSATISLQTKNACGESPAIVSKVVQIKTFLPSTAPLQRVCFQDCPGFTLPDGSLINCASFGQKTYPVYFTTAAGCDSLVYFPVQVLPPIITQLGAITLCGADCFEIDGQLFCAPGNFSVTLTSFEGCDSTVVFSIQNAPTTVTATANFDSIDCQHPFVFLTAATAFSSPVAWLDGLTGQKLGSQPTLQVFAPGLFVAVSGQGTACEARDTIQIFGQTAPFSASATGGKIACPGGSLALAASTTASNPTFSWSGPNGFSSNLQNPSATTAGIYTLIIGENGCLAADTAFVSPAPPAPTVSAQLSPSVLDCQNPCAQLTLVSSQPITGACAAGCAVCAGGPFSTTYFFGAGCSETINLSIAEQFWTNPSVASTIQNADAGQQNGAITISQVFGGQFPYTFSWSTGATTAAISGLAEGPFSVTITDAGGCTATFSFSVSETVSTGDFFEKEAEKIRLAPNPTEGSASLFLPKNWIAKSVALQIFAADGRLVEQLFFEKIKGETLDFDLKNQPSGLFWLKIQPDGERPFFKKLVKN